MSLPQSQVSFRILSQAVQISDVDFENSTFHVSTEIAILGLRSNLTSIILCLGRDCLLPNDPNYKGNGVITVNGIEANYSRQFLKLQLPDEPTDRSLITLKKAYFNANTSHIGDLIIEIPEQCYVHVQNQKVLKINIDHMVFKPKEGVKFSLRKNSEDGQVSGAYLFTYRSNQLFNTKEWLPCSDDPSQLCVWRFEISVPKEITAVCCGDLIDTISTDSLETTNLQKTFHYQLLVPTSACNIGFVIGDFQMFVQPEMPEIISLVPSQLMPLLKHTMSSLNRIFVFFEELLSCRFPYSTYWQVFIDQTPDELTTFAGLTIFSVKILYHKKILDNVQHTRQTLAKAVAQQFFGSFINSPDFAEIWLIRSISSFITGIFIERFFGICDYLYHTQKILREACEYESRFGRIKLRKKALDEFPMNLQFYTDFICPETCSPLYLDALTKKGHFIIRMLEKRLPKDQFIKVLQRVLSIGMQYSQNMNRPIEWSQLLISFKSFMRILTDVTGQEFPSFIEQWIDTGGHVEFNVSHTFNRKRNMIELELRQTSPPPRGCLCYVGPLTVSVQELDGHFTHTIQVDAAISKHDIQCHSKGRKLKKKRVLLSSGEEVDMDLVQMEADSPILWLRIDPEMLLFRQITISNQPFYQWEFILLYERDVLAQQQAIEYLHHFPRHQTKTILEDTVRNEKFYYRIRRDAAFCLVHIYNSLPDSLLGESPPLIDYFCQQVGCKTCPYIPQPNNYVATAANLQNYFLFQALPSAIGSIRGQGGKICPDYVVDFLLGLIRLNDNSINRYSDDYYRGALIHALGKTLVMLERPVEHPDMLSAQARDILEEVTHALNIDTMKPSFGRIVSNHCLHVLYELQRCHYIPLDTEVFWKFGQSKHIFAPLRFAAFACIVAMIRRSRLQQFVGTILRLIDVIDTDPDPYIRYSVAHRLCVHPPFESADNTSMYPLNTKRLAQAIWNIISNPNTDTRVRCYLFDLYFIFYGMESPNNFSSY